MTTPTTMLLLARRAALATTFAMSVTGCKLASDAQPDASEPKASIETAETVAPVEPELHTVGRQRPPTPAPRADAAEPPPADAAAEPPPATTTRDDAPTPGEDLVALCRMLEEAGSELDTGLALAFLEGPRAHETLALLKRFGESAPDARCTLIEEAGRAAGLGDDWRCAAACPSPTPPLSGLPALDEMPSTVGLSPRLTAGIRRFAPSTSPRHFVNLADDLADDAAPDSNPPRRLAIRIGRDQLAIDALDTDPIEPFELADGQLGADLAPVAIEQRVGAVLEPTNAQATPVGTVWLAVDASVPAGTVLLALEALPPSVTVDALAAPATAAPGRMDPAEMRLVTVHTPSAPADPKPTRWRLAANGELTVATPAVSSSRLELQVDGQLPWAHVVQALDLAYALRLPNGTARFTGVSTVRAP